MKGTKINRYIDQYLMDNPTVFCYLFSKQMYLTNALCNRASDKWHSNKERINSAKGHLICSERYFNA